MRKSPENLQPSRVMTALAVLVAGTAGGFALRTATSEPPTDASAGAKSSATLPLSSSQSAATGSSQQRSLRSRTHARPPEAVTISAEQWAKVIAEPDRYALSLEKLRNHLMLDRAVTT